MNNLIKFDRVNGELEEYLNDYNMFQLSVYNGISDASYNEKQLRYAYIDYLSNEISKLDKPPGYIKPIKTEAEIKITSGIIPDTELYKYLNNKEKLNE